MKIVLDCERMKYPFTGLFEYCYQLALAMRQIANANNDNLHYYIPKSKEMLFGSQSNFITQKSYHKILPPNFNADILHVNNQLSRYMRGNKNAGKVLTIHDLNFLYDETKSPSRVRKYLRRIQTNINAADHLVAISNFVKQDVLKHLDTKGKPFSVVYNGCNVLEFEHYDSPIYKPKKKFLFSIGTVMPKKNFHILPCILANNEYELIIAGNTFGDYDKKILSEARKYGVENRVKLIGSISYEDKYWYLKNCAAFMFPSIAEGFGIPIVEAMNFGKPTFLSTHTSLPEIGGEVAYYFENFEAEYMQNVFEKAMSDYTVNNRMAQIKKRASLFTWEKCAQEYYQIYKTICK